MYIYVCMYPNSFILHYKYLIFNIISFLVKVLNSAVNIDDIDKTLYNENFRSKFR